MYTITFGNRTFPCSEQEDLLQASKRKFVPIPSGCQRGGCGMCKVKIVEGAYQIGLISNTALTNEEREEGYVLACKTTPMSDLILTLERDKQKANIG